MEIYPAIDLLGGKAVRLLQGDYKRVTVYSDEPVELARDFLRRGADRLHIVDLDGARDGSTANLGVIERIAALDGVFIEVGGGIRDESRCDMYLERGAGRVIIGTAACGDFAYTEHLIKKYAERLAVGVDARDGMVAVKGWRELTAINAAEFCERLDKAGVAAIIYTDIARDGMLSGIDTRAYGEMAERLSAPLTASGGVSSLEELRELSRLGVAAAILGKSLYAGVIRLEEALSL